MIYLIHVGISLLLLTPNVSAWSKVYHNAVVKDAMTQLTPKASAKVYQILGDQPWQYGSWADSIRRTDQTYNKWHVIPAADVPLSCENRSNLKCGMIITTDVLKAKRQDMPMDVALKLLIHMVADAHQPLHVKYKPHKRFHDIRCFVTFDRQHKKVRTNMHYYMDSDAAYVRGYGVDDYAVMIAESRSHMQTKSSLDVQDWLEESGEYFLQIMPELVEGHVPSHCATGKKWVEPKHLSESDKAWLRQVSVAQLAKASSRLAQLLNHIFDPEGSLEER